MSRNINNNLVYTGSLRPRPGAVLRRETLGTRLCQQLNIGLHNCKRSVNACALFFFFVKIGEFGVPY